VSDPARIAEALERQLGRQGPTLLRIAIHVGARKDLGRPSLSPRHAYERFREFLQGAPARGWPKTREEG
jgi:hypothetical protein